MLQQHTVDGIKQLSEDGLSQRQIAKQFGVARETVRSIVNGKRKVQAEPDGGPLQLFEGTPQRCSTCGGLVYMPCLACQTRTLKGEVLS